MGVDQDEPGVQSSSFKVLRLDPQEDPLELKML